MHQAEIIILPLEESFKQNNTEPFIQRFAGSIPDFPDVEDELRLEDREDLVLSI